MCSGARRVAVPRLSDNLMRMLLAARSSMQLALVPKSCVATLATRSASCVASGEKKKTTSFRCMRVQHFASCDLVMMVSLWTTASPTALWASLPASFQTGELVFVQPKFNPSLPLDNAILDVGNATVTWLRKHGVVTGNETSVHVAMAWRNDTGDGTLSFIEAIPPAVRLTPSAQFWASWSAATFFHATMRDEQMRRAGRHAALEALSVIGKPYSYTFAPPPAEFYCSSLVRWAYQQATHAHHVFVDDTFPLIFVPRPFWLRYYASLNLTLPPPNTTGSNPTLLLHSPHTRFRKIDPLPSPPTTATPSRRHTSSRTAPTQPPPPPPPPPPPSPLPHQPPTLLSVAGSSLLGLTVMLNGQPLWPAGSLAFLVL